MEYAARPDWEGLKKKIRLDLIFESYRVDVEWYYEHLSSLSSLGDLNTIL